MIILNGDKAVRKSIRRKMVNFCTTQFCAFGKILEIIWLFPADQYLSLSFSYMQLEHRYRIAHSPDLNASEEFQLSTELFGGYDQ